MLIKNKEDPYRPALGIDIGRVISFGDTDGGIPRVKDYLDVPVTKDAISAIKQLNLQFNGFIYLVSKCKGKTQVRTRHWLSHINFAEETGVPADHVFFCESREGKAPICETLEITHFIDDRLEVLGYLKTVKNKFLFHPDEREVALNSRLENIVTRVEDWRELLMLI